MARRALVTGAARGIGAAIAVRLRADGLEVVTADRDLGCDLTFDVAGALPELGEVDVCVSNAAITDTIAPAHEMSAEQWAGDVAVNLTGAFRVIQACLVGMRERRYGRIVVVSSSAASVGLPGQVAYAASKAGLLGMMKTIASENVRRGITAAQHVLAHAQAAGLAACRKLPRVGVAGARDLELAGDVLAQPGDRLVQAVVEVAPPNRGAELERGGARDGIGLLGGDRRLDRQPQQLAEEPRVGQRGLGAGAQLARDHRAQVGQHEDLEAPLARHPLTHLAEQVRGHRVEQLGGGRPILH